MPDKRKKDETRLKHKLAHQLSKNLSDHCNVLVDTYYFDHNPAVDQLTHWANDTQNELNYLLRQQYFDNSEQFKRGLRKVRRGKSKQKPKWGKSYTANDLMNLLKEQDANGQNNLIKRCQNKNTLQRLIKQVKGSWSTYYRAKADYNKHPYKYLGKPKIPGYLKKGKRHTVSITNQVLRYKDGYIINPTFNIRIKVSPQLRKALTNPTNDPLLAQLPAERIIREYTIVPIAKNGYKLCVTYYVAGKARQSYKGQPVPKRDSKIWIAGDPGIDNLMTLVTNNVNHQPLIINGRGIKSVNQFYNKKKAQLQAKATKYKQKGVLIHKKDGTNQWIYHTGKQVKRVTTWRDRKIHDAIHKATDRILGYALDCGASKIIIGRNKYWKQKSNMNKNSNQNFTGIPHYKVIQMLKYKANLYGIDVISQPESYTSQTSFLDNELPVWRNGNKGRKKAGKSPITRRVHRGLFVTNKGHRINADINGALQIAHKYNHTYNIQAFCDTNGKPVSFKRIVRCVSHPVKWSLKF